jgi:CrcB protein
MEAFRPLPFLISLAAGGAAGTLLRYALSGFIVRRVDGTFPWSTLLVNVIGCFAIGMVAASIERGELQSPILRTTLVIGFLGGFTTFSTYGIETFRLLQSGSWLQAGIYLAASNAGGLGAVWLGYHWARLVWH